MKGRARKLLLPCRLLRTVRVQRLGFPLVGFRVPLGATGMTSLTGLTDWLCPQAPNQAGPDRCVETGFSHRIEGDVKLFPEKSCLKMKGDFNAVKAGAGPDRARAGPGLGELRAGGEAAPAWLALPGGQPGIPAARGWAEYRPGRPWAGPDRQPGDQVRCRSGRAGAGACPGEQAGSRARVGRWLLWLPCGIFWYLGGRHGRPLQAAVAFTQRWAFGAWPCDRAASVVLELGG